MNLSTDKQTGRLVRLLWPGLALSPTQRTEWLYPAVLLWLASFESKHTALQVQP
jgi:hypothetical protein